MTTTTILVVEDNPITRKLLRVTLEGEGMAVLEAEDGATALRVLEETYCAVVVQDFILPDMTGMELLDRMRATPHGKDVPTVLLTGVTAMVKEALAGGRFSAALRKPVDCAELVETVRTLAATQPAAPAGARRPLVVVVDNDPLNRKLMQVHLGAAGYRTTPAASAEAAVAEARRARPDAILADVLMPGLDGFQLCLAVRQDPALADVPIILLSSAYEEEADRQLALSIGASDLVPRRGDLQEAIAAIEHALTAKPPPAAVLQLDAAYVERLRHQVERQFERNRALTERTAIQAAALSLVGALSYTLNDPDKLSLALGDILVHCLDATGLSRGMLYLRAAGGALRLQNALGGFDASHSEAAAAFGHPELLEPDAGNGPRAFHEATAVGAGERAFLTGLGTRSVLVVPFTVLGQHYGSLVLASQEHDLTAASWHAFGRALASQLGQAITLTRTLTDLTASRRLFARALEVSPTGMLIVDESGCITAANSQIERIFGYEAGELTGKKVERLLPQQVRQAHVKKRQAFAEQAATRSMGAGRDLDGLHKDGRQVPVEVGLAQFEESGRRFVLASVVDITERKRVETQLREREKRFRQVVENIAEVFFVMDAQYRETLYISPAYEQIWGVSCQSLYDNPRSFTDPVSPEDRERLFAYMARLEHGEDPGEIEYRVIRPDGEVRWVLGHAIPVRNEAGQVYRVAGVALDITGRKRADEALRRNEQRLRTLFETVNLIVLDLDATGRVDYVNPYFLRITGYTREEVFGRDWFDFLPAAQRPVARTAFRESLERDAHPHYESPILTKDGEERMIAWHNTVLRDAQGRPTGTLSIAEDVTEQRSLEQQFRQAQKMEAVGRLAGGVAHDFNNLLTVITSYADLIAEELPEGGALRRDLAEIRKAGTQAASLTRQLLAFSRQQVLEPVVLNVNELLEDVRKMLHRMIGEDVELTLKLGQQLGNVRADPGQLQQVVMNLAVNARDAMPTGGSLLIETANAELTEEYADLHQTVVPGRYVLLAVTDSGTGMDAETRSRVFEPFFTTKEKGRGTGLGLSTVYGIVRQSNGYIWVYSELARGTTFKIYLPRVDAPAEGLVPAREPPAKLTGTETILVAEDDPMLRPLVKGMLERHGYRVLEAKDVDDAVALAGGHGGPIHLLLTDVVMPGGSGRDLARRLAEARPETRVLYVSGYTGDAMAHHGMLEPGLAFLQKPFTPSSLTRKVREVLDGAAR